MNKTCIICQAESKFLYQFKPHSPVYYRCDNCGCVFEDEHFFISAEEEKRRYDTHNNDVEDVRYQNFVSPIVNQVKKYYDQQAIGLDFGAGSGPVITKMLNDVGYQLDCYDPYYFPDTEVKKNLYDYIVCCETMEHFYHPIDEFKWMKQLLKDDGMFFGKTKMIPNLIDEVYFDGFGYKNDPTHVVFYSEKTLQKIKQIIGFSEFYLTDKIIILKK